MGVFRLFGFKVEVRPGFVLFLVLVVLMYGGSRGLWVAGSIAAFTLIHELGHATAARATGAHAEIALDFLAGYAAYVPRRPLSRWEKAGIAVAGATAQFTSAVIVMLLMGANPFSRADITLNDATLSIWWAGIVLALINLIPILPLDGGAILSLAVERFAPRHARRFMLWFSIAMSSTGVVATIVFAALQGFLPFAAILLLLQVQMLGAERRNTARRASMSPIDWVKALQADERHEEAAAEAANLFRASPSAELAALISVSLTACGDHDGSQAWMRLAEKMTLNRV
ncbi:MAG: hypothetical protein RJB08_1257 [Actinomycetota bacterium]|jgi:Zn-dependent protease